MSRTSRLICAILLVVVGSAMPVSAQDKPADFKRRVVITPEVSVTPTERPVRDPNAPAKLCSWKITNGTSFGKSGFCDAPNYQVVGSACGCSSGPVGRPRDHWNGTIILAPTSDGSTAVVR